MLSVFAEQHAATPDSKHRAHVCNGLHLGLVDAVVRKYNEWSMRCG